VATSLRRRLCAPGHQTSHLHPPSSTFTLPATMEAFSTNGSTFRLHPYINDSTRRVSSGTYQQARASGDVPSRVPKAFNAHHSFCGVSRLTSPHVTTTGKRKDATVTDWVNGHIHVTFHLMATAPIFQSVQISPSLHNSTHCSPQHEDSHQHGSPHSNSI
jgi:hypothetical protein